MTRIAWIALGLVLGCSNSFQPESFPPTGDGGPPPDAPGPEADRPSGEDSPGGPDTGLADTGPPDRPRLDVTVGDGSAVDVAPADTLGEAITRQRRRMDLDQLSASLVRVTDGIGWTALRGGQELDQFVELSGTLGKPDFVEITAEDVDPSALFQKFLDDAARSVCAKVVDRDATRAPGERLLARDGETEDATLLRLLLRFHGRSLSANAPDLEHWRWLIRSTTHVTGSAQEAWRGVCVALLCHPDFYSY